MWQFLVAGGPFMFLLVATSIVSLTFIIERSLSLRRKKIIPEIVQLALENSHSTKDLSSVQAACQQAPSVLSRLVQCAIEHLTWPKADNTDCVQTKARNEMVQMERGLVILEIIVGIAPLLGLVGTIHGLITLFGDLGSSGLNDNSVIAKGIGIALNTTLMGLLIAIPSLVAWSYFSKRVETLAVELETMMDDFLRQQYRRKAMQAKESVPTAHS
jgi:biopolymer transport protein ExbB